MVTRSERPTRILHLSDIHFQAAMDWDADPVRQALCRYIDDEVKNGLAPDLVVITGDMAFAGTAAEYALARKWLDDLWPKLGDLPRNRLLLVAGNHDVDRNKVGRLAKLSQTNLLSKRSQGEIATVMGDDKDAKFSLNVTVPILPFSPTGSASLRSCRGGGEQWKSVAPSCTSQGSIPPPLKVSNLIVNRE